MSSKDVSNWRLSSNRLRQTELWREYLYAGGLLIISSILFLANLGSLPLLDPVEGTLAQIAEATSSSSDIFDWIFPTLENQTYLELPPLVPNLIAITYRVVGSASELTTRFPGAALGALSVLIIYFIGREIFVARFPALLSALIYLTSIPILRYGRLATGEGALLLFELLMVWATLRSRRDLSWALITGISFSFTCLTQTLAGIQIFILLILFLLWDTPRLLSSVYFWGGWILGAIPSISWFIIVAIRYHNSAIPLKHIAHLFLPPVSSTILALAASRQGIFLQVFQYCFPWLAIVITGIQLIKANLHWGWGKLLSIWLGGYFILNIVIMHQNYWTLIPLLPALALVAGKELYYVQNFPSYRPYPQFWTYGFMVMTLISTITTFYWSVNNYIDFYLPFICGAFSLCLGTTTILIHQQDKQFIPLIFWGLLVSLFLLIVSPHWIWELESQEEIRPIAELVKDRTPTKEKTYSSLTPAHPNLGLL